MATGVTTTGAGAALDTSLTAALCPPIPAPIATISVGDAFTTDGVGVVPSRIIGTNSGLGRVITNPLNENAARLNAAGRLGGGGWAIVAGLTLSIPGGGGLGLLVAAGQAMIDGIVEVPDSILAVPDSHSTATDRAWVWLAQNKVLSYSTGGASTTPPAGAICLIGSCTTSGGNITGVDTNGVMFLIGGYLVRYTADIGMPTDTPPATLTFIAYTSGGCAYLWTGTRYERLWEPLMPAQDTLSATDVQDIPLGQQKQIFARLRIAGHLRIEGRLRVTT